MALQNLLGDLALDATLVTIDAVIDSIDTKTPALGQALAAASVPVVLTAAQITTLTPAAQGLTDAQLRATAIPVSGTFYQATQPVSVASMPSTPVTNANLTTLAGAVSATHMQVDVLTAPAIRALTSADVVTANLSATDNAVLDAICANLFNVFRDSAGRTITAQLSNAVTYSNVNASASSVTLLTDNPLRVGATFYNDSSAILYLKLGATASATSFTVKMQPDAYYEVPFGYYGIVDGISAAATGVIRVTEVS